MKSGAFVEQAWSWLERELDRWTESGRQAQFWWRDDDASAASDALERLIQMSQRRRIPLALAVIPAALESGLVTCLRSCPGISVLQHGFAHKNHAPPGQRKIEIGGTRPAAELTQDLQAGRQILEQRFGDRFVAALVPPWNRIDAALAEGLPGLGFSGLSTLRARRTASPAPGLLQVNVHLDPVNWRCDTGFIGVYPAIAVLVQHLIARRSGYRDPAEPSGILSHHLVQNEATWRFLDDLLQFLAEHPAASFVDAHDIWQ